MSSACRPFAAQDALPVAATGWVPLVTLAIGFVMAMLDVTVVNVAIPSIALQFAVPLTDLVWIVDGYTLTFAALLLVAGALADRYGAKTLYLAGLGVFTAASLLCGLAPNADTLIAARMLQGVGAALFMPSSLSLLTHAYDDESVRNRMLAAWSAIVAVAGASGPLLGGALIHQFGWRGIFLINIPLGLAGLWLARRRIASAPRRARALNPMSHVLGVVALSSLCFVLIQGNAYGWTSPAIAATMLLGLAANVTGLWQLLCASPAGPAAENILAVLSAPVSCIMLFAVGYGLQPDRDTLKPVCRSALLRIGYMLPMSLGLMALIRHLGMDVRYAWGALLFFALPPSYLLSAYVREERPQHYVNTFLSLYVLYTLAVALSIALFAA